MNRRAQLVLLAAALAAVALVPIAAAYAQLGAHPDVTARTDPGVTSDRVVQELHRSVVNASLGVNGQYAWSDRSRAVELVRATVAADARGIARAAANQTTAVNVSFNQTAAEAFDDCPGGPNRVFGDCRATDGVVVQSRTNETHLVAVALDVQLAHSRGHTNLTVVFTPC